VAITITPANPARPDFGGGVAGIDLREKLTPSDVAAIEAGMDRFAVLAFRDQPVDDDQQRAFSVHFGPLEQATGDLVMWDNRSTMHRATPTPADQVRDMRRTTIADVAPTLQQAA
jgi:alpha-ketoglutarate-dependent 2,4-dichlorophenoxyacetate dioxygenase